MENLLDESLLDLLESLNNPWGIVMFNPVAVQDRKFTVEFKKQDGTLGKITGQLVAPNYEGSKQELFAYTVDLLEKDLIPVYTEKGWRSFYVSKVVYFGYV